MIYFDNSLGERQSVESAASSGTVIIKLWQSELHKTDLMSSTLV